MALPTQGATEAEKRPYQDPKPGDSGLCVHVSMRPGTPGAHVCTRECEAGAPGANVCTFTHECESGDSEVCVFTFECQSHEPEVHVSTHVRPDDLGACARVSVYLVIQKPVFVDVCEAW